MSAFQLSAFSLSGYRGHASVSPTKPKTNVMKSNRTSLATIAILCLGMAPMSRAADDSFAGKWKLNPDKSQMSGLTYKVEDTGNNKMTFKFGDTAETVSLDGKPHTTRYGSIWEVTKKDANTFKWLRKRNGKTLSDATWTVAGDGATSTYDSTETRPDGSTSHDVVTLKRTAGGGSGLMGTWESTEIKVGSPAMIEIEKSGTDGYSMKNPAYQEETDFKTDGKSVTPKGPNVPSGMTMSAKQEGDNKMELTYKLKGKVTETDALELSSDGKTLTETITVPGEKKQEVDVFERQ
jgi:hypothetical protein